MKKIKRLMLALTMGLAVLACTPDLKMENPGETPENLDQVDQVPVICNFESDNMQLLWNDAPDCFWFGTYPSAHDDIRPVHLYERVQLELTPANVE